MLEEIAGRENLTRAIKQEKSNKCAPGVDGMSVDELQPWLNGNRTFVKAEINKGKY